MEARASASLTPGVTSKSLDSVMEVVTKSTRRESKERFPPAPPPAAEPARMSVTRTLATGTFASFATLATYRSVTGSVKSAGDNPTTEAV